MGHGFTQIHHIIHNRFFNLPEEVSHFYAFSLIRTVLVTSAALFLPLYIYKSVGVLFWPALYLFLSYGLIRVITKPLDLYVLRRAGVEPALFISILSLVIAYSIVHFTNVSIPLLPLVAFFEGFGFSLYWDSYHISFGLFGKSRKQGEEMAGLYILQDLINIITPLLSAAVIYLYGFHVFYTGVFVFSLIAAAILLKAIKRSYRVHLDFKDVVRAPLKRYHFIEGLNGGVVMAGPLYLFIVLAGSVMSFGWVMTVIAILSALMAYLIGKYFDKKLPLGLGRLTYLGSFIYGFIASIFPTGWAVSIAEVIKNIMFTFSVALSGTIYLIVRGGYPALTISRSFYICIGKSLTFLALVIVSLLVKDPVQTLRYFVASIVVFSALTMYFYKDVEDLAAKLESKAVNG